MQENSNLSSALYFLFYHEYFLSQIDGTPLGVAKGQLISKGLFDILNSPIKWTKKIQPYYYDRLVDLYLFVFWEK